MGRTTRWAILASVVAAVVGTAAIARSPDERNDSLGSGDVLTHEPASPARAEGEASPGNAIGAPRDLGTAKVPQLESLLPRRNSRPIGTYSAGRLEGGVRLPVAGPDHFTWDPVRRRAPNRRWRLWGTYAVVRQTLEVVREHRAAHPGAPRVGIGDLSRPRGGDFGPRFGLPGHASHQNGLDVDLYYPRRDRSERAPDSAAEINPRLSQDLVDRFVDAGAEVVFVGPNTGLEGPSGVAQAIPNHDNHLHVRFPRGHAFHGLRR
jgi:Penicillin-insensitive murein endopeptidase